jgi:hypothetical protein
MLNVNGLRGNPHILLSERGQRQPLQVRPPIGQSGIQPGRPDARPARDPQLQPADRDTVKQFD